MHKVNSVQIMIVAPSPGFYEGFCSYLQSGGYAVLEQTYSAEEALRQLHSREVDLVLVGPNLPESQALAFCRDVRSRWLAVKTVILTAQADSPEFQAQAANAGAAACLHRDISQADFLKALSAVVAGKRLFSSQLLADLFQPDALTLAENEVLKLLAQGKTDRQIATLLGISFTTARTHSRNIRSKLGAHTRQEAVQKAQRLGWIPF